MSKVLGVDVDLTVVDTGVSWFNWLNNVCLSNKEMPEGTTEYDLTKYFSEELKGKDGYEYFRHTGVYDTLRPIAGSVDVLTNLSSNYEVVFISQVKGNHSKSKVEFIKRYFPFYSGIVFTKEKHHVAVDIMVDDRVKFLNQFGDDVKKVLFKTNYIQDAIPQGDIIDDRDWETQYQSRKERTLK